MLYCNISTKRKRARLNLALTSNASCPHYPMPFSNRTAAIFRARGPFLPRLRPRCNGSRQLLTCFSIIEITLAHFRAGVINLCNMQEFSWESAFLKIVVIGPAKEIQIRSSMRFLEEYYSQGLSAGAKKMYTRQAIRIALFRPDCRWAPFGVQSHVAVLASKAFKPIFLVILAVLGFCPADPEFPD